MRKKTMKGWMPKGWQLHKVSGIVWHHNIIDKKSVKSFFNVVEVEITIEEL